MTLTLQTFTMSQSAFSLKWWVCKNTQSSKNDKNLYKREQGHLQHLLLSSYEYQPSHCCFCSSVLKLQLGKNYFILFSYQLNQLVWVTMGLSIKHVSISIWHIKKFDFEIVVLLFMLSLCKILHCYFFSFLPWFVVFLTLYKTDYISKAFYVRATNAFS